MRKLLFTYLVVAGCSATDAEVDAIAVKQSNTLGVTAIEVTRFEESGNQVVELRGIDADGEQRVLVRRLTGEVVLPTGEIASGSEISTSSADVDNQTVTRETQRVFFDSSDAATQEFLELDDVTSALAREANIVVNPTGDQRTSETPYTVMNCPASTLMTTPLAKECCWDDWNNNRKEKFYNQTTNKIVNRVANNTGPYNPCKASDGVSSCSGSACYYGPNGWARATLTNPPTPYWNMEETSDVIYKCFVETYQSPPPINYFSDVTGTFPTGRGCCVDGSGPCGPGITACTSCGGGGAAGQGQYDP